MVNTLLHFFQRSPRLLVTRTPIFRYAAEEGLESALVSGLTVNWKKLQEHWKEGVYLKPGTPLSWREIVLGLPGNIEEELAHPWQRGPYRILGGTAMDSYTIQAQRKGVCKNTKTLPAVIYALTLNDREDRIILGTRGGQERPGQIVATPAGQVPYESANAYAERFARRLDLDAIQEAVLGEGNEEIGVRLNTEGNELSDVCTATIPPAQLLGIFRQEPGSPAPSIVFVYRLITNGSNLERFAERHEQAIEKYQRVKATIEGDDISKEAHARAEMTRLWKRNEEFPVDAWENEQVRVFPNDPEFLLNLLKGQTGEKLLHGMYGALATYMHAQFGEKVFEDVMRIPAFQNNVKGTPIINL